MKIFHIPAFQDNYIWAIENNKKITVVDPGDANAVLDALKKDNLMLEDILITHHHYDHTGGVSTLKDIMQGQVYGPDNPAIAGIDIPLTEGESMETLGYSFEVIETPGHTLDHISFYSLSNEVLFCGDTLFSGGCGRLFEGSYEQLYSSLQKLKRLPDKTKVYCTHEYTLSNLNFAINQIADEDIQIRKHEVEVLLKQGMISLPSTIGLEKNINLFLGDKVPADLINKSPIEIFTELRIRKDNF